MQLEVCRSVADWLAHATNGINAELPNVPRDVGDTQPPNLAAVLDETRSTILALKRIPDEQATPFVFVWQLTDAELDAVTQSSQHATAFGVGITYMDRDSNAAAAIRDGFYVMRAARRSLNRLHENANVASRTRNNVVIRNGNVRMRLVRPSGEIEGAIMTAGLAVTYNVRDNLP